MPTPRPATPLLLFALALGLRAAWATQVPQPRDWDPAYYADVARQILDGQGATTRALWSLSALPERLPFVADLHWMPLPSRVLLPLTALDAARGPAWTTLLLAAAWAPLAWATARRLAPADPQAATLAGLFAALGGGYGSFLSTPDSIALMGAVGGAAFLALLDNKPARLGLLAALLTLTRGDGLLLAGLLGLGLGRRALWAWAPALGVYGAWALRNQQADPLLAEAARQGAAAAPSLAALVQGGWQPLDLAGRVHVLIGALPSTLATALVLGVGLLPPLAAVGAVPLRHSRAVQVGLLYAFALPLLAIPLAPAIASSGTVMRSWSAIFPLGCALAALGALQINRRLVDARGLHPAFLPGLLLFTLSLGGLTLGLGALRAVPAPEIDCAALSDLPPHAAVFAAEPLLVAERCDRPAVILPAGGDPARIAEAAARYDLRAALLPAESAPGTLGATQAEAAHLLPGWVCRGGLCLAPTAPSP